jgi:RHS repeat-associated protein
VTSELDCLPSVCPNNFILSISATYDLAGETTSLTYPDGQKVNYTYDAAEHALSAIGADNTNYTYNATYWPNGAQYRQWWSPNIYGRTDLNNRLQVAAFYSDNGVTPSYYLSKSYSYSTQNNGNVLEIYNNKDTTRNQSFTYDSLNRLTHAENSGTDCTQVLGDGHTEYWGNNYAYDAWGNLYQKNVTKCSAENMQATVTAQNRFSGSSYSYDANGNMLYDGLHHYTYDGENRITQVDSGVTSYLYDSMGSRVSETSANLSWTEYVDFGGNVIAERSTLALNSAMLSGSGFASGDFYTGAIVDGSTACCGFETDHESAGTWLQVDLGAGNTQAVVEARIYAATANYPGNWTVQYSDNASTWTAAAINFVPSRLGWNATGWASVGAHRYWRLYLTNTPGPGAWLNELQLVAETNYVFFNGKRVARRDPSGAVHYYLSDHLGSTTMVVSAAGAIENESDYYPWGGELKISAADAGNHYKFTGKERDAESGLDYFGARYYGNGLGRWVTPDAPFADQHLLNPQSWNLYMYAANRPTSLIDTDGREVKETRKTVTYDVHGKTAAEAHANALAVSGLKAPESGEPMMGSTQSRMQITNMVIKSENEGYEGLAVTDVETVKSADVNLTQTTTMPNWVEQNQASPEDQAAWNNEMSSLKEHEDGHGDINRQGAHELDKSLPGTKGVGGGSTAAQAHAAANKKLSASIKQKETANQQNTQKRNADYDQKTQHGLKQHEDQKQ